LATLYLYTTPHPEHEKTLAGLREFFRTTYTDLYSSTPPANPSSFTVTTTTFTH